MTEQEHSLVYISHQELLSKMSVSLEFIRDSLEHQSTELQALKDVAMKHTGELQAINGRLDTINGSVGRHDGDIRRHAEELREVAVHASESTTYAKVGFRNHNALAAVVEALKGDMRIVQDTLSTARGVVQGGVKVSYAGWVVLSAIVAGFITLITMFVRLQGALEALTLATAGK